MSICEQRWGQKDAFLQRSQIDFNSSKNKQIFGQIYEGFLGELQSASKTLGEYYTPRAITELLVELTALDRGREGSAPPLPPNRTCGFPAYGSPVRGFHIGIELTERGLLT